MRRRIWIRNETNGDNDAREVNWHIDASIGEGCEGDHAKAPPAHVHGDHHHPQDNFNPPRVAHLPMVHYKCRQMSWEEKV